MTVLAQHRRSAAVPGVASANLVGTGSVPKFAQVGAPANWNRVAASLLLHGAAILFLTQISGLLPATQVNYHKHESAILIAPTLEQPLIEQRVVLPAPKLVAHVRVASQTPTPVVTPKIEPPRLEQVPEPPKIVAENAPLPEIAKPPLPQKRITEGVFDSHDDSKAAVQARVREVQTGEFGDPNGAAGKSVAQPKLAVASAGSFDDLSGSANSSGERGRVHKAASVATAGFGSAMAGPASAQRNLMKTVSASGFADASASTAPAEASAKHARTPDITPVEILYKPKPVYTAEARQLHIEGEVLLDIMFGASGDVRVLRVLRGLGHGLDEAAEIAGQKIRFEPAKRDGRPYDSDAVVHIVFELAD